MLFKFTSLAVLAIFGFAPSLQALTPIFGGEVTYCTEPNFQGDCQNLLFIHVICEDLTDDFNDKISSVKPSNITECFLYQNAGCTGPFLDVVYPGFPDLSQEGFDDSISSIKCMPPTTQ